MTLPHPWATGHKEYSPLLFLQVFPTTLASGFRPAENVEQFQRLQEIMAKTMNCCCCGCVMDMQRSKGYTASWHFFVFWMAGFLHPHSPENVAYYCKSYCLAKSSPSFCIPPCVSYCCWHCLLKMVITGYYWLLLLRIDCRVANRHY